MNKQKNSLDQIFPSTHHTVFFHAHCDDESFLSAGILNGLSKIDRKCTAVYGASGAVRGQEQTFTRQQQTIEACSLLGIESVIFLNYCEPKYFASGAHPLVNQEIEDVSSNLWNTLLASGVNPPISLVAYDRNGGYGNKDHKTIHLVGHNLKKMHTNLVLLSEITINRNKMNLWLESAKKRLCPELLPQLSYWSKEFGLPEEEIEFCYGLTEKQLDLKYQALACHKYYNTPDLFPLALERDDFKQVFGFEFLHIPSSG